MNQNSEVPQADAGAPRREAIQQIDELREWIRVLANSGGLLDSKGAQHTFNLVDSIAAALDQRTRERGTVSDTSSIAKALAEAITVLDEPFHREAVARVMAEAVTELERYPLELQEVRGTVAAWKQECAQLVRKNEIAGHAADAARERITRERDAIAGLLNAKYLNPACAEHGCQWLQPVQQLKEIAAALGYPEEAATVAPCNVLAPAVAQLVAAYKEVAADRGRLVREPIVPTIVDRLYAAIRQEVVGLCPATIKDTLANELFAVREQAEADVARLVRQGEGLRWQPIQSAPRDSTKPILVLVEERLYPNGRPTFAYWDEDHSRWREAGSHLPVIPTHWFELPELEAALVASPAKCPECYGTGRAPSSPHDADICAAECSACEGTGEGASPAGSTGE